MKTLHYLTIIAISLMSIEMASQESKSTKIQKVILLMPDGSELDPAKFDSLKTACGSENMVLSHTTDEFQNGIYRISRKTDEDIKSDALRKQTEFSQIDLLNQPAPLFELKQRKYEP